ncbi:hypothetical protein [Flavobacterium sedimenticola]|uniref:Carboxypeptidase regulatory-like domain-containing protein n=1 Tax=Flavobacterium sedimenticola TaxID=3043286 RepID=A0ABT6XPX7_9FLAO|nr:hypothetical protein [Flavobacterium sedimenticola]MDI9257073.1 hypothetical protein [Flavobacterium sedimenticola]
MKKIHSFMWLLLVVVAFSGCESNDDNSNSGPNDDTFNQNFGNSVNRDFIGQVVDANNNPLPGVTIKIGASTMQTDINGVFIINDAQVYERFAYITAKKAGYIDGSRSMVPTTGKNNVKIMMISNTPLETIQSGVSGEVALPSGTKVVFDGAFEDANGNDYSGSVQVAMFHLLPSDENISKLMPGMLYAQTETNQQAVLETFGMLNVELRGSAGQKLNIKEGHTAEITLQIDNSQVATAPNTIPLWHFDEEKGYWKEEGVATKVGNKYVGEVSHFSWWNCDMPLPMVILTVTIVNADGNPISNLGVGLIANGNNMPSMGYTNTNGMVSGLIPANQTLTLNVYPDYFSCANNIFYTATIGPFNTNEVLPNIVINNSSTVTSSNVVGNLVKCDNANVTNGYVILSRAGGSSVSPVTNGAFSFNEIYCPSNTQFTLKGYDLENLKSSGSINYNFIQPRTNIGIIQTCNALSELISFQVDNNPPVILTVGVNAEYIPTAYLPLSINCPSEYGISPGILISGDTNVVGTYTTSTPFILSSQAFDFIGSTTTNTMQFHLNKFGAVGDYIDMTFEGTYTNTTGVHTLTGVVHVIRDN